MRNLYELSARYQQLLDQDELSEHEAKEFGDLHDSIEDECISHAKYIKNLEAELAGVSQARKEMQDREQSLSKRIERSKHLLADRMQSCNLAKITKSPLFQIKIVRNNPSVNVFDQDIIPSAYWRTKETVTQTIDKVAIKESLAKGQVIPGCELKTNHRIEIK